MVFEDVNKAKEEKEQHALYLSQVVEYDASAHAPSPYWGHTMSSTDPAGYDPGMMQTLWLQHQYMQMQAASWQMYPQALMGSMGYSAASGSQASADDKPKRGNAKKSQRGPGGGASLASRPAQEAARPRARPRPEPDDVAKLHAKLKEKATRQSALEELRGKVRSFTFDAQGCRTVQLALAVAQNPDTDLICQELHGQVKEVYRSPHGNYVLQKIIEQLSPEKAAFIAAEMLGEGKEVAEHHYGCRILCRLLEHHKTDRPGGEEATVSLIDEVVNSTAELCLSKYGYHVLRSVHEFAGPDRKLKMLNTLRQDLVKYATNKHASFVCERVLRDGCEQEKFDLADSFLALTPDDLFKISDNQFGSFVMEKLLSIPDHSMTRRSIKQEALDALKTKREDLKKSKFGRRVWQYFGDPCSEDSDKKQNSRLDAVDEDELGKVDKGEGVICT
eukprot:gnl/TRDRNA2_/TRDRNA2_192140_c0_seq1.p1 gnl/TRDRNA2_/TRDRNA2_192140_c0~~gnl/TRDRNA2_/TRDRNA2_192140_c0_seq1.p1  ORF type:complete len:463 (-),score=91.21 gnl/TRDRNA2_/TRDRNA2_192140_c0_seq1:94-1431(-)